MTLNDAIYQFAELGRGDDVKASQARQMAAWLKELRELRNKMRGVEALFGKGQIENLRREMKKMSAAAAITPPENDEEPKAGLSSTFKKLLGR